MSSLFDTRWHTQSLRFLFGQGARTWCPQGEICVHCEFFLWKSSALVCPSFWGKSGSYLLPAMNGGEENEIVAFAVGSGRWVRDGAFLWRASAENEGEPLDCDDAIFLTSSDSAASALLGYAQEEQEMLEGEEVETEPSQSSCPAYDELLDVLEHKKKKK